MRDLRTIHLGLLPLLTASLILAGCGRPVPGATESTVTTPVSGVNQRPSLPQGVFATKITITPNTAQIPVGEQRRLAVAIVASNGQTYTDPRLVAWTVSDTQAAMLDDQGIFTPQLQRVVSVQARLDNQLGEASITITPATYTWQQIQSPTGADLYAVKMTSSKEAWAGGAQGSVLHLYNGTWQLQNYPIPQSYTWRALSFGSPGDGWMVGHQGPDEKSATKAIAMAFRGGNWFSPEQTPVPVNGALLGVADVSANNAWAVGRDQAGKVLIVHWNGSSWTRDSSYDGKGQLNAIEMLGGSEGWAVGKDSSDALILHFNGTKWEKMSLPPFYGTFSSSELLGLQMLNNQQGYAVGKKVDALGVAHGLMLYYDGRSTTVINFSNWIEKKAASGTTNFLDQVPLHGISMIDGNQGWLLGEVVTPSKLEAPNSWFTGTIPDLFGNLLGFNGISYDVDNNFHSFNLAQEFLGLDVLPAGDGCLVGTHGYIMQRAYDWRNASTAPQTGMLGGAANATTPSDTTAPSGTTP